MRSKSAAKPGRAARSGFWPVSCKWLTAGTIAMYTAVGMQTVSVASAQTLTPRTSSTRSADAGSPQEFHVPPGMLGDVLRIFENATDLHIDVAAQGMLNLASPGVSGTYKPAAALDAILKDSGVEAHFTGDKTVLLEFRRVNATVDVNDTATALGMSTPKYTEDLKDTPQTITVVPQSVIQEQNATTLRDALRNVAGISLAAGEGGAQGDNLTIRGFSARNDLFIDGMRDFGSYYRDPFNTEAVQVLQGPSSVTFGRGSTGGVVNQATKAPTLNRALSIDLDGGTDATRRLAVDLDTPVPELGKTAAFRLNLMGDEANVAGRNVAENRRFGVAPSLSLGIGTPTRATFSYFHQSGDDTPDYGLPWLFNGPAPVNRSNYYGFSQGNFLRTDDNIGTIRVEHDFNSHITIRNQARYANYLRDAQITEPQIIAPVTLSTPLSAMVINRNQITVNSMESYLDDQFDVTASFATGRLQHTLVTGVEASREISDPTRPKYTNVPTTSLLDPDPTQGFSGTETISSIVHTTSNSAGAYFVDTVKLSRKWQVMGGMRWDRFNTHYTQQVAPAAAFNRLDELPTWRGGIVYSPVSNGSFYASAGTSFNPSAESLSLSAANANLPPEKNRTLEAGTKWQVKRVALTGAIFQTIKTNAREPDPNNPLLNLLAGDQRVRGAQVGVSGHVTSRWEILTSYALLDAKVTSSNYYPASVGAVLANVPRNGFNIWNEYRIARGWEIGAGGNFVEAGLPVQRYRGTRQRGS